MEIKKIAKILIFKTAYMTNKLNIIIAYRS